MVESIRCINIDAKVQMLIESDIEIIVGLKICFYGIMSHVEDNGQWL